MHKDIEKVLITEKQIANKCAEIGNNYHKNIKVSFLF